MAVDEDPKFFAAAKQLNEEFIKLLQDAMKESPYLDFSPCCQSYITQFKELEDNKGKGEHDQEDGEESTPPEPQVDKFDEPNSSFSTRCKLYEKVGSDLNVLGIGTLFLRGMDHDKIQVIVRQDPDLRKVILNQVIVKGHPVKALTKTCCFGIPTQEGKLKSYVLKFKDEKDSATVLKYLDFTVPAV